MSSVLASLVPVFLVIMAGWLARVTGFVEDKHWPGLEKVTYVVFFPAIIIATLARAELADVPVGGVGGALVAAILVNAGGLLALRRAMETRAGISGPSFTSIFQGATRWNTFVALAVAGSLFGERGLALMAVAIAVMIPLLNLMAIGVLVRFAGGPPQSTRQILLAIITNPFIWSSAIGRLHQRDRAAGPRRGARLRRDPRRRRARRRPPRRRRGGSTCAASPPRGGRTGSPSRRR